jgi:hypothetical protein
MKRMSDFFDINELDLLTEEEKKFNKNYVDKLNLYSEGQIGAAHIKNLTAGAATIAKRQHSRSAVALLKFNIALKSDALEIDTTEQLEDKS